MNESLYLFQMVKTTCRIALTRIILAICLVVFFYSVAQLINYIFFLNEQISWFKNGFFHVTTSVVSEHILWFLKNFEETINTFVWKLAVCFNALSQIIIFIFNFYFLHFYIFRKYFKFRFCHFMVVVVSFLIT